MNLFRRLFREFTQIGFQYGEHLVDFVESNMSVSWTVRAKKWFGMRPENASANPKKASPATPEKESSVAPASPYIVRTGRSRLAQRQSLSQSVRRHEGTFSDPSILTGLETEREFAGQNAVGGAKGR